MRLQIPFVLLLILISAAVKAQETDAGLWTTVSAEKQFSKKISVSADEEMRLKNNLSEPDLFFTNLGAQYRINKRFRMGLIYRFTQKKEENKMFVFRHRLMLDLTYRKKFYGFLFQYRSRIQSEIRQFNSSETGRIPLWNWRNKFEIKYDFEELTPYAGTEWFLQLKDPGDPEYNRTLTQYRVFAGIDYKINDKNSFGVYGLLDREINVSNPLTSWILGLQYSVQF